MKLIYVLLFSLLCFWSACTSSEKGDTQKNSRIITAPASTVKNDPKKETQTVPEIKEKVSDHIPGSSDFFIGYKDINHQKCGIYKVQPGDNVWIIAGKYIRSYLKKTEYSKQELGNVAYKINLFNYSRYPGGVNDELNVGDKVLIPLSE